MYLLQLKIMNKNKIRWQADFLTGRKLPFAFFIPFQSDRQFYATNNNEIIYISWSLAYCSLFHHGCAPNTEGADERKTLGFYIAAILIFIRHN
jgi:hypothetical protein